MEGRNERKRKKSEMDAERGGDKEEEFKEREKKKIDHRKCEVDSKER